MEVALRKQKTKVIILRGNYISNIFTLLFTSLTYLPIHTSLCAIDYI